MKIHRLIFSIFFLLSVNAAKAQISGCTDPYATNYNPLATHNDGSCTYTSASVAPSESFSLVENLAETSGLIKWHDHVWTHNDNDDTNIYSLDTLNGNLSQAYALTGATNVDWEEISQDDNYVYMGDFGNNATGNRTNLRILRIDKTSILANSPVIETINFSYSNQTNFSTAGSNNTDFDCEAFIVSADSIYLFTKQWISNKTSVYSLPKSPGTFIAQLKSTLDIQGLITGATYLESKNLVVLSGYSSLLQPFVYLLYDFKDFDFFGGNKRKIQVSLPFHQVEGITTTNGLKYYISNEKLVQPPLNIPQKLHILDLSNYLGGYLYNLYNFSENQTINNDIIFPNPATDFISINTSKFNLPARYLILNQSGQAVIRGKITKENFRINICGLSAGVYILKFQDDRIQSFKVIKR
jgi:hypothetical protein